VLRLIEDLKSVKVKVDDPGSICLEHAVTVDEYLAFRQSEAELVWSAQKAKSKADRRSRGLHPFLLASSQSPSDLGQNPRFWMAFGVPVGDAAIRHRIVSQFTLRHLLAEADDEKGGTSPAKPAGGGRLGPPALVGTNVQDRMAGAGGGGIGRLGAPTASDRNEVPQATQASTTSVSVPADDRSLDGVVVNRRINDDEASILYWVGLDVVVDDARNFIRDLEHYARHLTVPPHRPSRTLNCTLGHEESP
jgi:hypothetical protein